MGLEFMTGATMFALFNLIILLFAVWICYRILKKCYSFITSEEENKTVNIGIELFALGFIIVMSTFFGGVTQPKLTLDPVQNRELIEYQSNSEEVVIETPPPRTEKLDGFTPLK